MNFDLNPKFENQLVPIEGAGVQFTVPAGTEDVFIYNPGPDSLFLRAGGENATAAAAAYPIEFPAGFHGPMRCHGYTRIAARFASVQKQLTLWYGAGQ